MGTCLVVDDDPGILVVVEAYLTSAGHRVITSTESSDALPLAIETRPDVVVLDIMMPNLSGYDVLDAFRSNANTKEIPVIFLSARGDSASRVEGIRRGAADYLRKPFEPDELLARMERLMTSRAPASSGLQGSLEVYPLTDLIQIFERDRRTGVFSIVSPFGQSRISVVNGQLAGASHGGLSGDDAMLAMIELTSGGFQFDDADPAELTSADDPPTLGVLETLMEAAWLEDEFSRWESALPSSSDVLAFTGREFPSLPEGFEGLPIEVVADYISTHSDVSFSVLDGLALTAPRRLRLVVAWLVAEGVLAAEQPAAVQEQSSRRPEVVERVVASGARRGFPAKKMHVLFTAPQSAADTMRSVLPDRSQDGGEGGPGNLSFGNKLTLSHREGSLSIYSQILASEVAPEMEVIAGLASGIVVWLDKAELSAVETLVRRTQHSRRECRGLILAANNEAQKAAAKLIRSYSGWKVSAELPGSLEEALELLTASSEVAS